MISEPFRLLQTTGLLIFFSILAGCTVFQNTSKEIPTPEMVVIKGGTFIMGDIFDRDNSDAMPVHEVSLPDFRIGKYEVTYEEYDAFARRTDRPLPKTDSLGRGDRPAAYVSWSDAQAFCQFHSWRLPTEQEWEYAARSGGKKRKFAETNNIDSLSKYARTEDNSAPFAFEVGTKKPNEAGLYDMGGNVFEWIGAFYQIYPEKDEAPKWEKLNERGVRILRGGSFDEPRQIASTYWRVGILKEAEQSDVGFRCVDPLESK